MNWLNIRTEQMRSPEVAQASHEALGTWVRVIAYACEQENGGRLVGAFLWNDRAWMIACGVTALDVAGAKPLLTREGDDIIVAMYPSDKQKEVQKDRLNGSKGGRSRTQAKTQASRANGLKGGLGKEPKPNPSHNPTEGKGKGNGIGKEEEGNGKISPPDGDHAKFVKLWCDEYPQHHSGENYSFQSAKDGSAVKALLANSGKNPDELLRMAVAAWRRPSEFQCSNAASLSGFNSKFNEIRNELNTPKNGNTSRQSESDRDRTRTGFESSAGAALKRL